MHDDDTLLRRLCEAPGPPGAEDAVRRIVHERLDGIGRIEHDRLGSVICELRGRADGPRVVLDSHLDEVGFMVQSIDGGGRLRLVPLGGWWSHVLLGQRVLVMGEAATVPGVIASKPPHFLGADERNRVLPIDELYVDLGVRSRDAAAALGVRLGDPVVPDAPFREMAAEGVLSAKAFDNRVGVALMCEALASLAADGDHPNTVVGIGAVQEELGARGAGTAAELARPDVAIVLECTPADDLPGEDDPQAALGGGPQVRLFDPTALSNRRLVRLVERVARDESIEIQLAVRRSGGTDAGALHRHGAGVPTVVIGVPARSIHSHVGLLQRADYRAAGRLVPAIVRRLDEATVGELVRFD